MSREPDALTTPLSAATLEQFREAAASGHPMPGGVAVAAVSASFAFALLAKALAVSARRKASTEDVARLESFAAAARAESSRMLQLAGEDIAAFEACLAGARLPHSTDAQRSERQRALDCALRRATDLPLAAASSAAAGLQRCSEVLSVTHPPVLADLAAALTLLAGALRAFLTCAESNARQLVSDEPSWRDRVRREGARHAQPLQQAEKTLARIAATLASAAGPSLAP